MPLSLGVAMVVLILGLHIGTYLHIKKFYTFEGCSWYYCFNIHQRGQVLLRLRNRKRQKSALNLQIMDQIYRLTRRKKYIHLYLTASGVQFTVEGSLASTRTTLNKTSSKPTNEEATPSHPTTPNHTSK